MHKNEKSLSIRSFEVTLLAQWNETTLRHLLDGANEFVLEKCTNAKFEKRGSALNITFYGSKDSSPLSLSFNIKNSKNINRSLTSANMTMVSGGSLQLSIISKDSSKAKTKTGQTIRIDLFGPKNKIKYDQLLQSLKTIESL